MLILRLFSFVVGLTLITYVLFSYEDEEANAQNWLESAWVALDDVDKSVSSRINVFLQRLLAGLASLLRRIYGADLLSVRAFVAAYLFCLTLAATLFSADALTPRHGIPSAIIAVLAVALLVFLNHRSVVFLAVALLVFLVGSKYWFPIEAKILYWRSASFLLGPSLLFPTLIELLSIASIRILLRLALRTTALRRTLLVVAAAVGIPLATALCGGLAAAAMFGGPDGTLTLEQEEVIVPYFAWAFFNSSLIFIAVISATIARIAYATLPRAIYGVMKLKLDTNKKSMLTVGSFLVGVQSLSVKEFANFFAGLVK